MQVKNVCILGATGSIGTQTLDVVNTQREDFKLTGISANTSYEKVIKIINEFHPKYAVMTEKNAYENVKEYCQINNLPINVMEGIKGLNYMVSQNDVDIVVTSVVGMIGLVPTITAIKNKKDIALANKETLVVGGKLVINAAKKYNVKILPVDSEHGAIFQCLQGNKNKDIKKIILTASGGPFRGRSKESLKNVTVEEALRHPNWKMGKKISIDSATLMNKGLEVMEAHWLFNTNYDDIEVVIHPQSIIHSMVEYKDASVIAQLGSTDMKLPIQYALNYPERKKSVVGELNFFNIAKLTFEKPDMDTFKCLKLAYNAGKMGGNMPVILNAANEEAVKLFINKKIGFLNIGEIVEESMLKFEFSSISEIDEILEIDKKVREFVCSKYGN